MIVKTILMYMEFDKTINKLMEQTLVNSSDAKEDVSDIDSCVLYSQVSHTDQCNIYR